ncbi:MAG TPA: hypothetical protein PKI14_01380 [Fervidobacterium sp.]|nr:hypothetical protein [Fervidobacterium sp.]
MKRSEMITKLGEILNSRVPQDYQFSESELSDVLQEIENAGMQPPERVIEDYDDEGNGETVYTSTFEGEL